MAIWSLHVHGMRTSNNHSTTWCQSPEAASAKLWWKNELAKRYKECRTGL